MVLGRLRSGLILLVSAGAVACTKPIGRDASMAGDDAIPTRIDVCVMGAYVAPTKPDGTTWHPGPSPSDQSVSALKDAVHGIFGAVGRIVPMVLAADGLATLLGGSVLTALTEPNVYGTMTLLPRGSENGAEILTIRTRDNPAPGWAVGFGDGVCFQNVEWNPELKVRIHLQDQHWMEANDQDIATVYVKAGDISAAYKLGEVAAVPMAAQSNNALLLVSLDVRKR